MSEQKDRDQGRSDEERLYRLAIRAGIVLAALSVVLTVANYFGDFLSGRAAGAMAFGVFFWLLVAWGYRADLRARADQEEEARRAGLTDVSRERTG